MSFSRKKWCCVIGANQTFLGRIALVAIPTPKSFDMSLIEQGDIPHRANQISVQPESSTMIHPNDRSQLDTPTLTEETDKGGESASDSGRDSDSHSDSDFRLEASSEPFYKITCLNVEMVRLLRKRRLSKKPL